MNFNHSLCQITVGDNAYVSQATCKIEVSATFYRLNFTMVADSIGTPWDLDVGIPPYGGYLARTDLDGGNTLTYSYIWDTITSTSYKEYINGLSPSTINMNSPAKSTNVIKIGLYVFLTTGSTLVFDAVY